jgi:hypothetical protein
MNGMMKGIWCMYSTGYVPSRERAGVNVQSEKLSAFERWYLYPNE